jgi:hypothetical protein
MRYGEVKKLLQETHSTMSKFGVDTTTDYKQILAESNYLCIY